MKHSELGSTQCPVAQSLDRVGEWWSIMIMRDALAGLTRFDEFQKSLGIAPNMLTRRLNDLVGAGLLDKQLYCQKPPRHEYILTATGRDFYPVMAAFVAWGNRHFAGESRSTEIVDTTTGRPVRLGLVDLDTGEPIDRDRHPMAPGAGANERIRYRFDYIKRKKQGQETDLRFEMPARSSQNRPAEE